MIKILIFLAISLLFSTIVKSESINNFECNDILLQEMLTLKKKIEIDTNYKIFLSSQCKLKANSKISFNHSKKVIDIYSDLLNYNFN